MECQPPTGVTVAIEKEIFMRDWHLTTELGDTAGRVVWLILSIRVLNVEAAQGPRQVP